MTQAFIIGLLILLVGLLYYTAFLHDENMALREQLEKTEGGVGE